MSRRIQRLNELIKREVSQVILREIEFPKGILATITRAEVALDLSQAQIYISVIPDKYFSKILRILNNNAPLLQKRINQLLTIKKVPKIKFIEEKTTKEADRIEEILEEIKNNS